MDTIAQFLQGSVHFAYSKRKKTQHTQKKIWNRWRHEEYTDEEKTILAKRYIRENKEWYRSTIGIDHTLFTLDFDTEIPLADKIISEREKHAESLMGKDRIDEIKSIERFRFELYELAFHKFFETVGPEVPELIYFAWKFSGGPGRRHAFQRVEGKVSPVRFYQAYEYLANKMGMKDDAELRGWVYTDTIEYRDTIYTFHVVLDQAMTDPTRLIRGVYSPHFKDKVIRFSIPIPVGRLYDHDYIRERCYKVPTEENIEEWYIPPFKYEHLLLDEDDIAPQPDDTVLSGPKLQRVKRPEDVSMLDLPVVTPPVAVNMLNKLQKVPCMRIGKHKSHPARTRFGNVATQKFSPEVVAAYFRDYINDDQHNENLDVALYHLYRLKPFGQRNFGYWNCNTFKNQKNEFKVWAPYCREECPVEEEFGGHQMQSPWWVLSLFDRRSEITRLSRTVLRRRMKRNIMDFIASDDQFHLIQAAVRSGKTRAAIEVISLRSWRKLEKVFYVGNIEGTKINIVEELLETNYEGNIIEWGSKQDLCPIRMHNPSFVPTAGYCASCNHRRRTDNSKYKIYKTMDKRDWIDLNVLEGCNYYAMRKYTLDTLQKNENTVLVGDPRVIMRRDVVLSISDIEHWMTLFDYIVYDESHSMIGVVYDNMVNDVTHFLNMDLRNLILDLGTYSTKATKLANHAVIKSLAEIQKLIKDMEVEDKKRVQVDTDKLDLAHDVSTLERWISEITYVYDYERVLVDDILFVINFWNWLKLMGVDDNKMYIYRYKKQYFMYMKPKTMVETEPDGEKRIRPNYHVLPLHLARKVLFMSATPNDYIYPMLYFPVVKTEFYPRNQIDILFNLSDNMSKRRVTKMEKSIEALCETIISKTHKSVLLVTDNKSRVDALSGLDMKMYHPRDAQNAEGTTLRGFSTGIAINISQQNLDSVEYQTDILSHIFDYARTYVYEMFDVINVAKVIQALARITPYKDEDEPVQMILLDTRFLYFIDYIIRWLSPVGSVKFTFKEWGDHNLEHVLRSLVLFDIEKYNAKVGVRLDKYLI